MTIYFIFSFVLVILLAIYLANHIKKMQVFQRWEKTKRQKKITYWVIYIAVVIIGESAVLTTSVLLGSLFYFIVLTAFWDIIFVLLRLILRKRKPYHVIEQIHHSMVLVLVPVFVLSVLGYHNAITKVETPYEITIHKETDGLTFLAVSDTHIGTTVKNEDITWLCDQVQKENPDALFLVGDIFDENTTEEEFLWAVKEFGRVAQNIDVIYVYGNHEQMISKDRQGFNMDSIADEFGQAGITVLQDEAVFVDGMYYVAGRRDVSEAASLGNKGEGRKEAADILSEGKVDTTYPVILLDHQPVELETNAKDGLVDLQISGHTHGDQVYPFGYLAEFAGINEMTYGIRTIDEFSVVVSSGLGTWGFPMRVHSQSEYVKLSITRA